MKKRKVHYSTAIPIQPHSLWVVGCGRRVCKGYMADREEDVTCKPCLRHLVPRHRIDGCNCADPKNCEPYQPPVPADEPREE